MDIGFLSGMSAGMLGALFGAIVAIMNLAVTLWLASRLEADKSAVSGARSARLIKNIALVELLLLPLAGYLIWPMVMG